MRKQPLTPEEFKTIYSQVPRLTVELIIRNKEGVLLKKREEQSWAGMWHIPGGTVLYKETIKNAASRIAKEELGILITVGTLLGYIEYPSEEAERGFGWSVGLAVDCQPIELDALHNQLATNHLEFFSHLPSNCVSEQLHFLRSLQN